MLPVNTVERSEMLSFVLASLPFHVTYYHVSLKSGLKPTSTAYLMAVIIKGLFSILSKNTLGL